MISDTVPVVVGKVLRALLDQTEMGDCQINLQAFDNGEAFSLSIGKGTDVFYTLSGNLQDQHQPYFVLGTAERGKNYYWTSIC